VSTSVVNEVINQDDVVLEAVNLQKYLPTGASKLLQRPTQLVQAVDGVSFSLRKGKTLAIVGESGCGKSTLARLLARLIEPTSGSVLLNGENVSTATSKQLLRMRRDIQVVFHVTVLVKVSVHRYEFKRPCLALTNAIESLS